MSRLDRLLPSLVCPDCRRALERRGTELVCAGPSAHRFAVRGEMPIFLAGAEEAARDAESRSFFNMLKAWLKRRPGLYRGLTAWLSPVLIIDRSRALFERLGGGEGRVVVNLGSGPKHVGREAINLDLFPFPGVDVVASATRLPFADASVDGVVTEYVLEHVPDAARAVEEIRRVLRPGGLVYVALPFLEPYHESPNDYYRWTAHGIARLFPDYEIVEHGIAEGPTGTLNWVLQEWLSLVLSLGWEPLRRLLSILFMILLWPIKALDLLVMRLPGASAIAAATYYLGRKPLDR
jgi:SAM-dependent methyltransferase